MIQRLPSSYIKEAFDRSDSNHLALRQDARLAYLATKFIRCPDVLNPATPRPFLSRRAHPSSYRFPLRNPLELST